MSSMVGLSYGLLTLVVLGLAPPALTLNRYYDGGPYGQTCGTAYRGNGLSGYELCDLHSDNCNQVSVYGYNFGGDLHCYIVEIQVGELGNDHYNTTVFEKTAAEVVNYGHVRCRVDFPRPVFIRVSNDDLRTTSSFALFVPYHSKCFDCNVDRWGEACCLRKRDAGKNVCFADGRCYLDGDRKSRDCEAPGGKVSRKNLLSLIAIPVVLVLILVLMLCCFCWRRKRTHVPTLAYQEPVVATETPYGPFHKAGNISAYPTRGNPMASPYYWATPPATNAGLYPGLV